MLNDTRSDHACIPRPLDEHLREDDVADIHAEECDNGKHHDLAWEREHDIDDAHDDLVHRPAEVAGTQPHKRTKADRAEHRERGKPERRADAVEHARENAAAELIRAEQILPAKAGKFVRNVVRVGIVRADPRCEDAQKHNDTEEDRRPHRRAVVQKSVEHVTPPLSHADRRVSAKCRKSD